MNSFLKDFKLGVEILPQEPASNQVIYVESHRSAGLEEYIRKHLRSIKQIFRNDGLEFVYLPTWIDEINFTVLEQTARYYLPWIKITDPFKLRTVIKDKIRNLGNEIVPEDCAGITVDSKGTAYKIDLESPGFFEEQILEIGQAYGEGRRSKSSFKMCLSKYLEEVEELYQKSVVEEEIADYVATPDVLPKGAPEVEPNTNDIRFREVVSPRPCEPPRLPDDEIDIMYEQLRQSIPDWVLRKIFADAMKEREMLSKMVVSPQNKLILTDYDNMEIELRPLEMAFYFLYLKHPEGINFKDLVDYKDELWRYYKHTSIIDDKEKMMQSMERLLDPFSGSVNQQRSRIARAINESIGKKFRPELARYYMIEGAKGEDKKILIPRDKVDFSQTDW